MNIRKPLYATLVPFGMRPVRRRPLGVPPAAWFIGLMLVLVPVPAAEPAAQEQQPAELRAQLREIQARLRAREKALRQREGEAGELRGQLAAADEEIQQVALEIEALRREVEAAQQAVHDLAQRRQRLERRLRDARNTLALALTAAHRLNQGGSVRVLLSLDDPQEALRAARYLRDLRSAILGRLTAATADLEEAAELERLALAKHRELAARREALDRRRRELTRRHEQRRERLGRLERIIAESKQEIGDLKKRQEALRTLIDELEAAVENLPTPEPVNLSRLRGRLPWPAQGSVKNFYGRLRPGGGARWQGAMIQAPLGSPVRAVARGRVVYADWFRGYGLLLIVDHGGGYMSLYGYNQAIFKQLGEWVEAGERIASVGMSGLRDEPGVYFELRHHGKALDPGRWCTERATTVRR